MYVYIVLFSSQYDDDRRDYDDRRGYYDDRDSYDDRERDRDHRERRRWEERDRRRTDDYHRWVGTIITPLLVRLVGKCCPWWKYQA